MDMTFGPSPHPLDLYRLAVQHPLAEVAFVEHVWAHFHGDASEPMLLREDFAGTYATAAAWVASDPERQAMAIELDEPTAAWAADRFADPDLHVVHADVMAVDEPVVDVTLALNFSVLIYHEEDALSRYLAHALRGLNPGGLLIMDVFGGPGVDQPSVQSRAITPDEGGFEPFTYRWEQRRYDPQTQRIDCRIHFALQDGTRLEDAFTYDWRLWPPAQLIDLARRAGFGDAAFWWSNPEQPGRYQPIQAAPSGQDWVGGSRLGALGSQTTVAEGSARDATRTRTVLILIIAGGPDKGRLYELTDGAPIVLGREGDQVKLNDNKVSREHARLWSEGGQWYLKDMGSRHGTFRNHVELEKGQHAKLKDGDYLQVGNTVMVLGRMQASAAERSALLGGGLADQSSVKRSKMPVLAAGLGLAAALGMGAYLAVQLHELRSETVPREELAALHNQLEEIKDQSARETEAIKRSAKEMTDSLTQTSEKIAGATQTIESVRDPLVQQLEAAKERATQQQLALEQIGNTLAKQADDNSDEVLAAVTQMKSLLEDQPTGDQLIARLEEAINDNATAAGEAVQLALAEHRKATAEGAIASAKETEALMNRVLESLAQVPTREQLAEEVQLAIASAKARDEQFMRLVVAELRKTGDQIATDVTAAVGEETIEAQTLMKQVVAELDKRPTGEQLAADLRVAMDEAFAKRETNSEVLPGLMKQVLSELEQRPTSEQLAADLRRVIGEDAQRTELLIARVMSGIDQRPTAAQIASELQATDNEAAAKTAALLEEVLDKVQTQDELALQIAGLRKQIETMPGTNTNVVKSVLDRLDEQDRNSTAMLLAIAELRSAMPTDLPSQLDKVLEQLGKQVRTDQITNAIEESMQRIAAKENQQTAEAVAALSKRLDALPTAEELGKLTENQAALAKLLDESDAREDIAELRASLQQVSDKLAQAGSDDEQLKKIIAMLEKREKTELLVAELHDAMDEQSAKTEQIKKELLASIEDVKQPDTTASLNQLLAMVREKLVTDESIRQAIRDEMRGAILPNQRALADARDVTTTSSPGGINDAVSSDPAIKPRRLTRLESAYKQSFESGQPVTIGSGVVDPKTGEVSKGRLIDPAVAKALGFETWRDWYLTDRHAEQMRLQREALRQRNENEGQGTGSVQLPPIIDRSESARPEQD
eukprot:g12070.t1